MQRQYFYFLTQLVSFLHKRIKIYLNTITFILRGRSLLIDQFSKFISKQIKFISMLLDEKHALINTCNNLQVVMRKLRQEAMVPKDHMNANTKIAVIKEMTIKSLEPHVGRLITKHKREIERLNSMHLIALSNVHIKFKDVYDHKVKLIHERNIIDVKRTRSTTTSEMLLIVKNKLEHIQVTYQNRRHLLVNDLHVLRSKLKSINAEILIERACFVDNFSTIKSDINSIYKNMIEKIGIVLNSVRVKSRQFWMKEFQKCERENAQICNHKLLDEKKEIYKKLKLEQEIEIERIINRLEASFNEEKKCEQLHHTENLSLLKARYEEQVFDLMQSNYKSEETQCLINRCIQCKDESDLDLKFNLISPRTTNEALGSLPFPRNEPFLPSSVSHEQYSSLLLENTHLKHYIKKLEFSII